MNSDEFVLRYRDLEDPQYVSMLTETIRLFSGDSTMTIATAPLELLEQARDFLAEQEAT